MAKKKTATPQETEASKDLATACFNFLATYLCPPVNPENIFRGWQNYYALPRDTNTFIVFSIGNMRRIGTNLERLTAPEDNEEAGNLTISTLYEFEVNLWLSGDTDMAARDLAMKAVTLTRNETAVRFFRDFGASALYAEDPVTDAIRDEHNAWVPSWRVTLHLSAWFDTDVTQDYFNQVDLYGYQVTEGGTINGH